MIYCVRRGSLLLGLLLLVLLATACGEDDGDATANGTEEASTPALKGAAADFMALLTIGLDSTYTATYETTTPEGDLGDLYIVTNSPPQTRIDTIALGSSSPTTAIISGDTLTIGCGNGPETWECVEIEPLGDSLLTAASPIVYFTSTDLASFDVVELDSRTLVGQAARCFGLRAQNDGTVGDTEYCLAADGVPLTTTSPFGTVEVTELSREVSDEDFLPPAELLQ